VSRLSRSCAVAPKCLTLPQVASPLAHPGPFPPPGPQCFGRLALAVATSTGIRFPTALLKVPCLARPVHSQAPHRASALAPLAHIVSPPSCSVAPTRRSSHFYGQVVSYRRQHIRHPSLQVSALAPLKRWPRATPALVALCAASRALATFFQPNEKQIL
jgi:hypothetical protein